MVTRRRARRYIARPHSDSYPWGAALPLVIILLLLIGLLFVNYLLQVFLLVFAGILLAILLRTPTDWLAAHTPVPNRWALLLVVIVFTGVIGVGGWWTLPGIAGQVEKLIEMLPLGIQGLKEALERVPLGQVLLNEMPPISEIAPGASNMLARVSGIFSGVFGLLVNLLVILFLGLYLAFEPHMYINGFIRLLLRPQRRRAAEVIAVMGYALRWWLVGRLIAMLVLGLLVGLGLLGLGVPFPWALGILTGLLAFIPIVGAIIAVVPVALVAIAQDLTTLLYVLLLFYAVQTFEGYVLTPLVQERIVALPPVLAIVMQLLLGILAGPLGVALAVPLTVVALVLVKMLYLEDVLGESAGMGGGPRAEL